MQRPSRPGALASVEVPSADLAPTGVLHGCEQRGAKATVVLVHPPVSAAQERKFMMRIVVIGGTGLIGSKLVAKLAAHGQEAVPAAPSTGVNILTGEGLGDALADAEVVVDVSNSPSFEDTAVLEFFEKSTRKILDAEAAAGVGHHVALSVVGTDRMAESGYMRAKIAQEKLIENSSIPYTIVHATQFFEFAGRMADEASDGDTVRVPPVLIQPIAADDVAAALCNVALAGPLNNTRQPAGRQPLRVADFVPERLRSMGDQRAVVADLQARYFR